jgi:hypothetical protein
MPVADTPRKIENSTTAMVEVLRAPVRDEGEQGVRQRQLLGGGQLAFEVGAARDFGRARGEADGAQAVQLGHQDADAGGDGRGHHQGADGEGADLAQRRGVAQLEDGLDDRDHDERHDDHLQQLDVAGADHVEPGIGLVDDRRPMTMDRLQGRAQQHAQAETREDALGKGDMALLEYIEQGAHGGGDGQVQDQFDVHGGFRRCPGGVYASRKYNRRIL